MSSEIATIHGRDVERTHRRQRIGLIPVIEMALIFLHLLKRVDGCCDAIKRLGKADPAKVTRRNHREKIHADIGWRRTLRNDRSWIFLEVIGRKMVVFLIRELGEIAPGTARIPAQSRFVGREHFQRVLRLGRTADEPGNER